MIGTFLRNRFHDEGSARPSDRRDGGPGTAGAMPVRSCDRRRATRRGRRGVASVLAMMFLVIFGSLAAVMAVVAQGNLRTAQSHLQVNRSMSAAETGLTFASRRLLAAANRFVVEKGTIDEGFADDLWFGTWDAGDGDVVVLPPEGFEEDTPATSLVTALLNAHAADEHGVILNPGDELLPDVDELGKLVARPIALSEAEGSPTFQLSYEPLADGRFVRVVSVGRDGDLTRTLRQDFQIVKHLDAAIISPNRIMVGKNVHIDGPIGTRYGETAGDLEADNGHPLVMRSDFLDLDPELDERIQAMVDALALNDVDGDNRLRPGHPGEQEGLVESYMTDVNGDGYVDDYDLWVGFYDDNANGQIVYDADKAFGAGHGSLTEEFSGIDEQLAVLIDRMNPDRDGDGDTDSQDTILGYDDGIVDNLDEYAKVRGHLLFKADVELWEGAQGGASYQNFVNGPVAPTELETAPVEFEVEDTRLYDLTPEDFADAQDALKIAAQDGQPFASQLASQLGGDPASHVWSDHLTDPDYLRQSIGLWEQMPAGSPGFYDWYQRPVYKNMTFVNVTIPYDAYNPGGGYEFIEGTTPRYGNGLFVDCTFIGAVYIQTCPDNEHVNWNYLGTKEKIDGNYVDKYDVENWEPVLMMEYDPTSPGEDPVYDTKPFSNNIRFHDCTFIGSVVTDPATELTHVRNKIQFTGNTVFTLEESAIDELGLDEATEQQAKEAFEDNLAELEKSSLMAPNFSVDVGNFENADEKVELQGTIVAGVMDIRGSAEVVGTLLMTYKPVANEGPLYYGGSVAAFNTTLGYFGPEDGDGEGSDPSSEVGFGNITLRYDPDIPLPDGIMAPIKVKVVAGTYAEGAAE